MSKRLLPPLKALHVFEAVARHLSITRAAAELCVTEPAVSQQIKLLEQHFGKALFLRHARGVELTGEGKRLLPVLQESFDRISETSAALKQDRQHSGLRVQLTPHFSAYWVAPRLGGFIGEFPGIELSIRHSYAPIDHAQPDVDIAVAWDPANWKGAVDEPLMHLGYLPMCSPELLPKQGFSIADLPAHTLIQERGTTLWHDWFAAAGIPSPHFARIIDYDNYDVAVHAAVQGQGIAILMYPMFRDLVNVGKLVAPFGTETYVPITCSLLYDERSLRYDKVKRFRDWIVREASADPRMRRAGA